MPASAGKSHEGVLQLLARAHMALSRVCIKCLMLPRWQRMRARAQTAALHVCVAESCLRSTCVNGKLWACARDMLQQAKCCYRRARTSLRCGTQ
jgi:hypothetical protein